MAEEPSTFFTHDYRWKPCRAADVHVDLVSSSDSTSARSNAEGLLQRSISQSLNLSFQRRNAMRTLIYAVLEAQHLRNIFDGVLLPPPYFLHDFQTTQVSRAEIEAAVEALPPELDLVIVLLPFHLAVRTGLYDARLRAAMFRLCELLCVPWSFVLERESLLANTAELENAVVSEMYGSRREEVHATRRQHKLGIGRVATVGAFAVIGGAALVVTGGLAAPLVAPAFAGLVSATSATLGLAASVGGVILGGGVLAGAFAGAIGAVTHAAALGALLTPVLSAVNMTAIFGISGAGLAGYKGLRRTADPDVFLIRSTHEIEVLPALAPEVEDREDGGLTRADRVLRLEERVTPPPVVQPGDSDDSDEHSEYGEGFLESRSSKGIVVPAHTRSVSLMNLAASPLYQRRRCAMPFAIECQLPGMQLELRALRLFNGVWGNVPPKTIPNGYAGVAGSANRFGRPTGTSCILMYELVREGARGTSRPLPPLQSADTLAGTSEIDVEQLEGVRFWVLFEKSFVAKRHVSFLLQSRESRTPPGAFAQRLSERSWTSDGTAFVGGLLMVQVRFSPQSHVVLRPMGRLGGASGFDGLRETCFPIKELAQRVADAVAKNTRRRYIGVAVVNHSKHAVKIARLELHNGTISPVAPVPQVVSTKFASFTLFTNADLSLQGAEGTLLVKVHNTNDRMTTRAHGAVKSTDSAVEEWGDGESECPVREWRRFFIKLRFEVSALNRVNVGCLPCGDRASAASAALVNLEPCDSPMISAVPLPAGLFFAASLRVNPGEFTVAIEIVDDVERSLAHAERCVALTIGVSGFTTTFDPRRHPHDQQVALWQPVLSGRNPLFARSDAYAVHWEDEFQKRLGETIGVDSESAANILASKALGAVKKQAKQTVMKGAVFMGMRAFDALIGTLALPLYAVWAADLIDNTFATLANRAEFAGKDLAAALLSPERGYRPVTLVGFSFGARVIAECLAELHRVQAFGIVENAYLLGATVSAERELWNVMRAVVAGRLVNVYTRSDWLLWLMFKANEGDIRPMAGVSHVNIPGVENIDVTSLVESHAQYALKLDCVLRAIPPRPTKHTWRLMDDTVSPGAVVAAGECPISLKRILRAMWSPLSSIEYAAISFTNRIATDIDGCEPCLFYVGHLLHDCHFEFFPPELVLPSQAAVFGVFAEEGALAAASAVGKTVAAGGVVAYAVDLSPASECTLVIFLLFSFGDFEDGDGGDEKTRQLSKGLSPTFRCVAKPVPISFSPDEPAEQRRARLLNLLQREGEDLDRIAVRCRSAGFSAVAKTRKVTFDIPFTATPRGSGACAADGTAAAVPSDSTLRTAEVDRDSVCPVTVSTSIKEDRCGAVAVLALLTKSSSGAERAAFDDRSFDRSFSGPASSAPSSRQLRGRTAPLPRVATPIPMERKHDELMAVVREHRSTQDWMDLHRSRQFSVRAADMYRKSVLQPIVLINCGSQDLYYHLDADPADCGVPVDVADDREDYGPQETAHGGAGSAYRDAHPRHSSWVTVPASVLPPQHCAITILSWTPSAQVLENDGEELAVDAAAGSTRESMVRRKEELVAFFTLESHETSYAIVVKGHVDTPSATVTAAGDGPAPTGGVAGLAASKTAAVQVLCAPSPNGGDRLAERTSGRATHIATRSDRMSPLESEVSSVEVDGTSFILVLMSPQTCERTPSACAGGGSEARPSSQSHAHLPARVAPPIATPGSGGWTFFNT